MTWGTLIIRVSLEVEVFSLMENNTSAGDMMISAIADAVAVRVEKHMATKQRVLNLEHAAEYLDMTPGALTARAGVDIPCLADERLKRRLKFDRRDLDRWIDRQPRDGYIA